MTQTRNLQFAFVAVVAALAALVVATSWAAASHVDWVANPGTSYSDGVVTLDSTGQPAGTSYENADLDVPVANGDVISFEYMGDCGGGAPRVFIQGGAYNTWDADPAQCPGTPVGDGWFELTGTVTGIVDGEAGYTGIVNDNIFDPGVVQVRNLVIGGESIALGDVPTEKDDCKKGGWADLERADGTTFKNQGLCIKYVNTGR